jgi:N-acyl-D-amino-acid deacylase
MRYWFLFLVLFGLIIVRLIYPDKVPQEYDCIIRKGLVYDGLGSEPYHADLAIQADTIAVIGDLERYKGKKEIDASGLAVAPGFINMLSWADENLLQDGFSVSDIKQGITLEVFGEGFSPAPVRRNTTRTIDSLWTTLGGYFSYLEKKGFTPNVASFVGATSIRIHEMNFSAATPSARQLQQMEMRVKEAMEEGAMGLGTSLIYAPANYAQTAELIALAKVAAVYGGMYITHMRSEGDFILPAINETIRISKEANIPAEIYHLKVNLHRNWNKIDGVLGKIDSARKEGIRLTANMYPYPASGTGLNARLPLWAQEGGASVMRKRIQDPLLRKKILYEMERGIPSKNSDPDKVVLMRFRLESLNRLYRGKTLSEAARIYGKSADETVIDLILKDRSRIESLYFQPSEDVLRKVMQQPYVSFGSDAGSYSLESGKKPFADHPRAFGAFARVLGKYVREEKILTLQEAIRKMTSLPATNLKLYKRGRLESGSFADILVFDPHTVTDRATFEDPHQYAEGMVHVFVNGVQVLKNGNHTHAKPGRILRGPGWKKKVL